MSDPFREMVGYGAGYVQGMIDSAFRRGMASAQAHLANNQCRECPDYAACYCGRCRSCCASGLGLYGHCSGPKR